MPAVERSLFSADPSALLVYPGILARYNRLAVFEKLRQAHAPTAEALGFIILMPGDERRHMRS
jgi:hypothetical protein